MPANRLASVSWSASAMATPPTPSAVRMGATEMPTLLSTMSSPMEYTNTCARLGTSDVRGSRLPSRAAHRRRKPLRMRAASTVKEPTSATTRPTRHQRSSRLPSAVTSVARYSPAATHQKRGNPRNAGTITSSAAKEVRSATRCSRRSTMPSSTSPTPMPPATNSAASSPSEENRSFTRRPRPRRRGFQTARCSAPSPESSPSGF